MDYLFAIGTQAVQNAPYVVGFVMPFAVRVITKDIKAERDRQILAFLTCLFASLLLHWKELALGNPVTFASFLGLMFTESNMMYKLYFSPRWKTPEEKLDGDILPLTP